MWSQFPVCQSLQRHVTAAAQQGRTRHHDAQAVAGVQLHQQRAGRARVDDVRALDAVLARAYGGRQRVGERSCDDTC